MAEWLEAQEDLSLEALTASAFGDALTGDQIGCIADNPAERDVLVAGLRQSVLAFRVLEAERETARQREGFEALLTLVVEKAEIAPGDGRWPHRCGREHRLWAIVGDWRAGGQSSLEAREALKDVIRTALTQQTGGADAA